jgi:outer membrane murein-binding lipoprotein Lpp
LERQLAETRSPATAPIHVPVETQNREQERELAADLARLRVDYEDALAGKARLEQTVNALSSQWEQARATLESARTETDSVRGNLRDAQSAVVRANQEMDSFRSARANDARTIADQRLRLSDLSERVREQAETIQRERELLAAGKEVRDLMGARNLHVFDVRDDGMPGKKRPIPGRVFYTEGKSLIFYAYDLENKANPNKVAFQVWGKKEGLSQPARSLGILYQDDASQKRWMMKFEDPAVLAQIDQVFVTVEQRGGAQKPTRPAFLMAAFLNDSPNHP